MNKRYIGSIGLILLYIGEIIFAIKGIRKQIGTMKANCYNKRPLSRCERRPPPL